LCCFIQDFIGHGIVTLSGVAEPGRYGGEKDKIFEIFTVNRIEKRLNTVNFGIKNPFELFRGLFGNELVFKYACPVDDGSDRAQGVFNPAKDLGHICLVSDIH